MQWRACLFSCSSCLQSYKLPDVNHLLVWIDVICFTDVARIAETRVSSINDPVVCNWLVCWLWMLKESLFAQTAGHLFKIQSWKRTYAQSCSAASPLSWRISWPFTSPGGLSTSWPTLCQHILLVSWGWAYNVLTSWWLLFEFSIFCHQSQEEVWAIEMPSTSLLLRICLNFEWINLRV